MHVDIKRQVVENDRQDKGRRMILNFGHTLGHSLEKTPFSGPSHGEAVSVGMVRIVGPRSRRVYSQGPRINCLTAAGLRPAVSVLFLIKY